MKEEITIHNTVIMFRNESQFKKFVKLFCNESKAPDYFTWKIKTENRLLEANKKGENLISVHPQLDSFMNWAKDHPSATDKEKMAKLIMSIV